MKGWVCCLAVLASLLGVSPLDAAPPEHVDVETEAAVLFDTGVEHFQHGQFEAAARAFLRADSLKPDSDTLNNALVAAQKSNEHLLVTHIVRRALDVHASDAGLVSRARTALAAAASHLAHVTFSCSPDPCQLYLDGEEVESGAVYVNPGTHRLAAAAPEGTLRSQRVERRETLLAGTTYVFDLSLDDDRREGSDPATSSATADPVGEPSSSPERSIRARKIVFYSAVSATALLASLTTFSGIDAMNANDALPERPSKDQVDRVDGKVLRTDVLLSSTILVGAFSVGWGIWGVDFGRSQMDVGLGWSGGPQAAVKGRFQ